MEHQPKIKRKLAARLPGHLLERISWKDWPLIAKESVNDDLVISLKFLIWLFVDNSPIWTYLVLNVSKHLNTQRNGQRKQRVWTKNLLYRSKCCVVLEDEIYFTFDGSNMQGNNIYYTNESNCLDSVRFVGKEKFPPKVMVWVAICKCGISKPLIRRSKSEAVNSDNYDNFVISGPIF
jgi:hypothetical protein